MRCGSMLGSSCLVGLGLAVLVCTRSYWSDVVGAHALDVLHAQD